MDVPALHPLPAQHVVAMNPGDKRGSWTFVRECEQPKFSKGKRRYGLFRCVCGTERAVGITMVINGNSRSCGCQGRLEWRRRIKSQVNMAAARWGDS
jgi:hypothetical protein